MLQKLRERMGREQGFTLIELLVVMLILGVLAAIAIPSFINQREKAQDSDAKAMARTMQTAIETYATDNNGRYTGATFALLDAIEPTLEAPPATPGAEVVGAPTASDYTVRATSASGREFNVVRTGGTFQFTCSPNGGGCDGDWGN
jgi:type IV pilus assembly protein PilA